MNNSYNHSLSANSKLTQISANRCFDGEQHYYSHQSSATKTQMTFSIYLPDEALAGHRCPAVLYLSGLTCNADNVTHKAHFQKKCSELGMIFIAPDTSPRSSEDNDVPNDERYFVGQGASYYVDATQAPWAENFNMQSYIVDELYDLLRSEFSIDSIGVTGHSMGGHGALLLGFKFPSKFISVSALSPVCSASESAWGQAAYTEYFGDDDDLKSQADAAKTIEAVGQQYSMILVDQGAADNFLAEGQLQTAKLQDACEKAKQPLTLRYQAGHDHSYYFIQSVIDDHIEHHWRMAQLN
ncbi:MAG: S-formylglutathione hydrolase [Psychrobacter sp.]|uniref:S-formylglutathione hydrolase n=3 Tax=Psychrobacter sp. TaxID=56811 RepID=UPI00264990C1|nr:S-formylglutathione hydrolase [Psychrobacter sp.]MDN6276362.1 S-formylglutathione hydrolase [Psychrobacter sp.]MDN6308485.1 S-formylglutathione hydrolase [Psychrobacter sp.]